MGTSALNNGRSKFFATEWTSDLVSPPHPGPNAEIPRCHRERERYFTTVTRRSKEHRSIGHENGVYVCAICSTDAHSAD
eukprot:644484-Pyramimonas_sp.AAC.1